MSSLYALIENHNVILAIYVCARVRGKFIAEYKENILIYSIFFIILPFSLFLSLVRIKRDDIYAVVKLLANFSRKKPGAFAYAKGARL